MKYLVIILVIVHLDMEAQIIRELEPSRLEIRYRSVCGKVADTFIFRCGETKSQYFSSYSLWRDSMYIISPETRRVVNQDIINRLKGIDPNKPNPYGPCTREYLYRDSKTRQSAIYTSLGGVHYCIRETIPDFGWIIYEDSVSTILGLECTMAESNFRGRDWKVWFAFDIPISQGPWKFGGLPGMILKAESPGFITLEAIDISTENLSPVNFYNYNGQKYEDLDRKAYLRMITDTNRYPKGTIISPQLELE